MGIDINISMNVFINIDIDIDIFKSDLTDIDIDIFKKCRYIDNRYGLSIYRTPLLGMQWVQLSTLLLVETARGGLKEIPSSAASVSDLSTLEERSDRLRTLGSSSTAIRAWVETLLAAPLVPFSTGEAES